MLKDHLIMGIKNAKPLIVTAIVLVAIVAFIIYQNQKDAVPAQSKNNKAVVIFQYVNLIIYANKLMV